MKLNEQADWYETHEKSLSKAVRAVVESKAAKRLDDAKTNLTAKLDEASKLLADSDGKVADNATRDALSNAIDAANGLKDGNDPAKIDGARKTLEDAINGVNASVQAKTDADAQPPQRQQASPPTPAARTGARKAPLPAPTHTVAPHRAAPARPPPPPQSRTSTALTAAATAAPARMMAITITDR